jgi:hypothetical protein
MRRVAETSSPRDHRDRAMRGVRSGEFGAPLIEPLADDPLLEAVRAASVPSINRNPRTPNGHFCPATLN